MRIKLTPEQAAILAQLHQAQQEAQRQFNVALTMAGVDPAAITGGDLSADRAYLEVKEPDAEADPA